MSKVKEHIPETCSKCGQEDLIIYSYRGKKYCHDCFESIYKVVSEVDEKHEAPLEGPDYLFFPGFDDETRTAMFSWIMANAFIQIERHELAYAWLKCGFIHPDIVNIFRKAMGESKVRKRQFDYSRQELKKWDKSVKAYLKWDWERGEDL